MQIWEFMHGAVMRNSSTNSVKQMIFRQPMSKTRRKITTSEFIHGAVMKNSSTTTAKTHAFVNTHLQKHMVNSTSANL